MSRIDMCRACSKYIHLKNDFPKTFSNFNFNSFFFFYLTNGICKTLETNTFDKNPRNPYTLQLMSIKKDVGIRDQNGCYNTLN